MKYYIYISDDKVDMLYAQIPQSIKSRIATEIKIDLKVFSTSFKDKDDAYVETRYSKLALVVDYIENHLDVGSLDNPKAFFKGTMPMYWGPFGHRDDIRAATQNLIRNEDNAYGQQIIFFAGKHGYRTVGLGGSMKHVIGSTDNTQRLIPGSMTYTLLALLSNQAQGKSLKENQSNLPLTALFTTTLAIEEMKEQGFPVQRIEFLARTLVKEKSFDGHQYILGSPIYASLAED